MDDAPFDLPETALSTSGAEGRPHVLVLCFSPLARDARVLRRLLAEITIKDEVAQPPFSPHFS